MLEVPIIIVSYKASNGHRIEADISMGLEHESLKKDTGHLPDSVVVAVLFRFCLAQENCEKFGNTWEIAIGFPVQKEHNAPYCAWTLAVVY